MIRQLRSAKKRGHPVYLAIADPTDSIVGRLMASLKLEGVKPVKIIELREQSILQAGIPERSRPRAKLGRPLEGIIGAAGFGIGEAVADRPMQCLALGVVEVVAFDDPHLDLAALRQLGRFVYDESSPHGFARVITMWLCPLLSR